MGNQSYDQYKSQINIKEIGIEGQKKLRKAKVLIVGVGGLGCINALYLTSSGIGTIGLVDDDKIEISNISRQPLFGLNDIGKNKVDVACKQLIKINSNIKLIKYNERLTVNNVKRLFHNFDLIIDCSDNFPTKFLINDYCQLMKKPFIYGSIFQFQGYAAIFIPTGPCYRCIQNKAPKDRLQDCSTSGALSTAVGIIGLIQSTEAIKYITGITTNNEKLIFFDAKNMSLQHININKDKGCNYCNKSKMKNLKVCEYAQYSCHGIKSISPFKLLDLIKTEKNIQLLDVREPSEVKICKLKNSINIPLKNLEDSLDRLDKNKKIIVYCHHGIRSRIACDILIKHGFESINLAGGIDRWATNLDKHMNIY